jgi:hypothetical protein
MRRILAVALTALALAPAAPAHADPQCAGAFAAGYSVGYCTESVCSDTCVIVTYPICEQPASSRADVCAIWTTVLPDLR